MLSVKGVAFDLDGTLLDSVPDLWAAANATLAAVGRPPIDLPTLTCFVGNGTQSLVKRFLTGKMHDPEPEPAEFAHALTFYENYYRANVSVHSTLYPGALETLGLLRARGVRMGCVTNKAEQFTLPLLEAQGLRSYFDVVVCGDSLPTRKPDPEMLHFASARLGVRPAALLMVGDSANDAQAGRAAGCPVAIVTYGYRQDKALNELEADVLVTDLREIPPLIA